MAIACHQKPTSDANLFRLCPFWSSGNAHNQNEGNAQKSSKTVSSVARSLLPHRRRLRLDPSNHLYFPCNYILNLNFLFTILLHFSVFVFLFFFLLILIFLNFFDFFLSELKCSEFKFSSSDFKLRCSFSISQFNFYFLISLIICKKKFLTFFKKVLVNYSVTCVNDNINEDFLLFEKLLVLETFVIFLRENFGIST